MRLHCAALLSVLAAACGPASSPAAVKPPANHVEDPAVAAAKDPLAFLPVDSDALIGFDFKALRASALWKQFQPLVQNALDSTDNLTFRTCVSGQVATLGSFMIGVRLGGEVPAGVLVIHGVDAPAMVNCIERDLRTRQMVETVDRGVIVGKTAQSRFALAAVGASTIVLENDATANHDTFAQVLAAGVPLRGSPAFLGIYDKLERGASMWAIVNGNAKIFESLAGMGAKVRGVDGTIVVADKVVLAGRMTVDSPDSATNLANMVTPQLGQAKAMFERLDVAANGPVVRLDATLTAEQIKTLLGLFGIHS